MHILFSGFFEKIIIIIIMKPVTKMRKFHEIQNKYYKERQKKLESVTVYTNCGKLSQDVAVIIKCSVTKNMAKLHNF